MGYKKGDRIKWIYKHWLNSKSYTIRMKRGEFISYKQKNPEWCKVHFDGNKHPSYVRVDEIK